jgi:hypothetical protein
LFPREALVGQVEVVHAVDVGFRIDDADPEAVAEQDVAGSMLRAGVATFVLGGQAFGGCERHGLSPLCALRSAFSYGSYS